MIKLIGWVSGGGNAFDICEVPSLEAAMAEVHRLDALVDVGDPNGYDGCDIEAMDMDTGIKYWLDSDDEGKLKWEAVNYDLPEGRA